jgi:hypothetical protein
VPAFAKPDSTLKLLATKELAAQVPNTTDCSFLSFFFFLFVVGLGWRGVDERAVVRSGRTETGLQKERRHRGSKEWRFFFSSYLFFGDQVGQLDLQEMTHMPEVDERRIRLHTKQGVFELGEFDPADSQDKWLRSLTAFKKKRAGGSFVATLAGSGPIAAAASSTAASTAQDTVAHTYKLGDMVWCEFVDDLLWYRGVLYFLDGKIFKVLCLQVFVCCFNSMQVVFIEYSNTQDCVAAQIRPIDDAAMLALAEKPLSFIVSPGSIDGTHPLTVQIPQKVAVELRSQGNLRRGTIMRLDPKQVVQQLHDEIGQNEPEPEPETEPEVQESQAEREESSTDLFDWALQDDEEEQPVDEEEEEVEAKEEEVLQEEEEEEAADAAGEVQEPSDESKESKAAQIRARLALRRGSGAADSQGAALAARRSTLSRGSVAEGGAAQRLREKLEARKKDKLLDDEDDET